MFMLQAVHITKTQNLRLDLHLVVVGNPKPSIQIEMRTIVEPTAAADAALANCKGQNLTHMLCMLILLRKLPHIYVSTHI